MHDFGHSSFFADHKSNYYVHLFYFGMIKGGNVDYWNHMHNQHHAKPNVIGKDPDTKMDPVFVLGEIQPLRVWQIFYKLTEVTANVPGDHLWVQIFFRKLGLGN